ncbi:MAG: hypothetical protein A2295_01325 [Candidatus Jacksonbacteria bacterium RIFOXYB2_FULL_44_15]|nr:MAG: hypothetical protein UV19_C0003G0003 [Parcubacteria group bacterium GW2011_GWA2_42_28]KKT55822.1 MAG: hypothetical protein UW45_C0004G0003 [Parcubacteria group bacterium GW2011_GWC2_44_22]OGY75602.1 MAG: hypothetical protein A2240_03585 [Candidatus Jacksonbacteria bacterium RIFOXYA2_FULL_43_12]OGY76576.1 MAG: hypothetical protein A2295_01325 [Candidatus Jacksonbacteria bacterium RIFOXYB2_FULL_44_15]OGY81504.1 MAG: hypothetical protein A2550_00680 [Candidatus Jacksonbacteria bacterium RI
MSVAIEKPTKLWYDCGNQLTIIYMDQANNQNNQANQPKAKPKKSPWKLYLHLGFVLILVAVAGYGYFWYQDIKGKEATAAALTQENQELRGQVTQYEALQAIINQEYKRCQELIAKGSGEFAQFEYCKQYNAWVDALKTGALK